MVLLFFATKTWMVFCFLQVPELPIYETVRKIPTGRMARGRRLVQLGGPPIFLQDGAENMKHIFENMDHGLHHQKIGFQAYLTHE